MDFIKTFLITFLVVVGALFLLLFLFGIYSVNRNKAKAKEIGATKLFNPGRYLGGFPDRTAPTPVLCCMTDSSFIFLVGDKEIGAIPRDGIESVDVEDRTTISRRLTATRIATLGVFSLAAPKKEKAEAFYMTITWRDTVGSKQEALFEFASGQPRVSVNRAVQEIRAGMKPFVAKAKAGEKKCPYCAEIIKDEAIVCRYCGRDLAPA